MSDSSWTNSIDAIYGADHPSRSEREALHDLLGAQAQACLNRADIYIEWMRRLNEAEVAASRPTGAGRESVGAPRPVPTFQVIEGRRY